MTTFCSARSCSSLAAALSLFLIAFWYALSAATLSGILGDHLADAVGILPVDVAELVVECLDDVAQAIQLGFGRRPVPGLVSRFFSSKVATGSPLMNKARSRASRVSSLL